MAFDRLRAVVTSTTSTLAVLSAFLGAGIGWTVGAGSVLAPEPADLVAPLGSATGATAPAVTFPKPFVSSVPLWPAAWTPGGEHLLAGTPCSPWGIPAGGRTTRRIEARGRLRRCVDFDTTKPPPANAVRPLPAMPVATGTGTAESLDAVAVTGAAIVEVVSWPASWTYPDAAGATAPYPGQPCSDFALLAGESTHKHVQTQQEGNPEGPFRCVRLKDPIVYPGP